MLRGRINVFRQAQLLASAVGAFSVLRSPFSVGMIAAPSSMALTANGKRKTENGKRPAAPAFVLLEIIIAMALFSLVAVAMVQALDQIAKTSKAARAEGQVMRVIESVLAEVVHQPKLKPGSEHFEPGADGVEAQATIEKIKLTTRNKAELSKMYLIHVDAWVPQGRAKTFQRQMKTYVYSPNSPEK